jgi:hypothetical protein
MDAFIRIAVPAIFLRSDDIGRDLAIIYDAIDHTIDDFDQLNSTFRTMCRLCQNSNNN